MTMDDLQAIRRKRLRDLLDRKFDGNKAALGRALGYAGGAFVRQMLDGERPITEKTVQAIEALPGAGSWFAVDSGPSPSGADSAKGQASPGEALTMLAGLIAGKSLIERKQLAALLEALATDPQERAAACQAIMRIIEPADAAFRYVDPWEVTAREVAKELEAGQTAPRFTPQEFINLVDEVRAKGEGGMMAPVLLRRYAAG